MLKDEMKQFVLVTQNSELPNQRDDLCNNGCNRCSPDAPIESVDEDGVEDGVDNDRVDGGIHSLLRMTGRADDGI